MIDAGHIGRARLVEAGVKAALLDERLFLSAAIYDQARIGVSEDDDSAVLDAHVSATTTRGFEAELKWEAAENLLLSFYGLHQETRFTPNVGANIMVDARALGFRDVVDASGNVIYPAEAFLYGGRAFVVLPPGVTEYAEKQGNPGDAARRRRANTSSATASGFTLSGNYFSRVYAGRLRLVELPEAYVFNVGLHLGAEPLATQIRHVERIRRALFSRAHRRHARRSTRLRNAGPALADHAAHALLTRFTFG